MYESGTVNALALRFTAGRAVCVASGCGEPPLISAADVAGVPASGPFGNCEQGSSAAAGVPPAGVPLAWAGAVGVASPAKLVAGTVADATAGAAVPVAPLWTCVRTGVGVLDALLLEQAATSASARTSKPGQARDQRRHSRMRAPYGGMLRLQAAPLSGPYGPCSPAGSRSHRRCPGRGRSGARSAADPAARPRRNVDQTTARRSR